MSGRGAKVFAAGLAAVLTLAVATGASRVYLARASRSALTPALGTLPQCAAYDGLPHGWGQDQHAGMVRIKAGDFQLGSDRGYAEERPLLDQAINTFWIDRTEVTNAQFASFVAATGYVTEVEHHPGVAVFHIPANNELLTPGSWWHLQEGADWLHPEGPQSSIVGRAHEPVVDVTYADALAYAHLLGHELPSEAQWEFAAKAGRGNVESDHSLRDAHGHPLANFWQGMFPLRDTAEDGFAGRAPVGCFAASRQFRSAPAHPVASSRAARICVRRIIACVPALPRARDRNPTCRLSIWDSARLQEIGGELDLGFARSNRMLRQVCRPGHIKAPRPESRA